MINSPSWYDWDKANPKTLAYAVSRLLSPGYFSSWDQFSTVEYNNPRQPTSKDYLSLEYIHNIVHVSLRSLPYDQKLVTDYPRTIRVANTRLSTKTIPHFYLALGTCLMSLLQHSTQFSSFTIGNSAP